MIEPPPAYYDDEDSKTHGNDEAGKDDAIAAVQSKCESAMGDVSVAAVRKDIGGHEGRTRSHS